MADTYTTRSNVTINDYAVNPQLGIRIGCDACRRIVTQDHALGGAVLRLATDLARYGAERTRNEDGSYRHARRSATILNPALARPRLTLEAIVASEAWYASHKRVPSEATIASLWTGVALDDDEKTLVREALEAVIRDSSAAAERIRAEQDREWKRRRREAREARGK